MKQIEHQAGLPLVGQVNRAPIQVPDSHIAICPTEQAAFRMCMDKAQPRMSDEVIVEKLQALGVKVSKHSFSRIKNADRAKKPLYANRVLQVELQRVCNNRVIDRWAALYEQGMLDCQRSEAELAAKQELELIESRAAELKTQLGVA